MDARTLAKAEAVASSLVLCRRTLVRPGRLTMVVFCGLPMGSTISRASPAQCGRFESAIAHRDVRATASGRDLTISQRAYAMAKFATWPSGEPKSQAVKSGA